MYEKSIWILIIILISCLFVSFFLTSWFYQYIINRNIVSIPNARSLHTEPKVRGGGAAILISCLLSIIILFFFKLLPFNLLIAFSAGAAVLGIIGWIDDYKGLPILIRFPSHFILAVFILFFLNGHNQLNFLGQKYTLYLISDIILVLFIVWMINLYNFMDGVDGLALSQAIIPSAFLSFFFWNTNYKEISIIAMILIASSITFYKYNWPPSKMFMGDGLSGFLGFFFAALALYINNFTEYSPCIILVLVGFFIFDSTYTLFRRLFKGEKIWEAHSTHFYQRFARIYGHKKVTVFFILLNFVLFLPAYGIFKYPYYDIIIVAVTYSVIFIITIILKKIFLIHSAKSIS